ncbi:hypothetical protein ACQJBY_073575 [Aegilops geniculata]
MGIVLHTQLPSPPLGLWIGKLKDWDGMPLCLITASFTVAGGVDSLQVISRYDGTNKENNELVTSTLEACIGVIYMMKLTNLFSLKKWTNPNVRIFRDTCVLVIMSYLLLLDISMSFIWLAILPLSAIVFTQALYFKLSHVTSDTRGKVTPGSSNVGEKTVKTPVELQMILVATFGALLVMDQLNDDDAAMGFAISQFLLFLSFTVAVLTRMMMKLPADRFKGSAPASVLLHKTLLLLLLVTLHTVTAEWLGQDVVLFCMLEVIPVLLWFSLHLDRPPHSPLISVDKIKQHRMGLIALGALVVALLVAYQEKSMDLAGLSWIMVSCGVSGVLTYYLVFMLHYWHWPWQKQSAPAAARSSSDDNLPLSGMLKVWAHALLIAATVLLLLRYPVAIRYLQQSLVATMSTTMPV